MEREEALQILVDEIHSAVVATTEGGRAVTRAIDMMLYDEKGVYFLTAKGKEFYRQLTEQKYISLTAVKDKRSVTLRGDVKRVGADKLDEIFAKNPYMKEIYPRDTRSALEVFLIYRAKGEYFDIGNPSAVQRFPFSIGEEAQTVEGYYVGDSCIGCRLCYSVCPQKCIDVRQKPAKIDQSRCLHCGRCAEICPKQTIRKGVVNI